MTGKNAVLVKNDCLLKSWVRDVSQMIERFWGTISDFIPWPVLFIDWFITFYFWESSKVDIIYSKRKQKRYSDTVKCYIKN